MKRLQSRAAALRHDVRGTASVEYVIALCLVSVGASIAVVALGSRLLELFVLQRAILVAPMP